MKQPICTSVEQSHRLLSCGVDPKTADMCWEDYPGDTKQLSAISGNPFTIEGVPAWSLSALISLLPMSIGKDNGYYPLQLQAYPHEEDCYKWCLAYYDEKQEVSRHYTEAPTPIEACVRMIEWLSEHKYEPNKTEE